MSIAIYIVVFQLPNVVACPVQLPAKNAALFPGGGAVFAEIPGQAADLVLLPLKHPDFLVGQRIGFYALFDAFMLTIKTVQQAALAVPVVSVDGKGSKGLGKY